MSKKSPFDPTPGHDGAAGDPRVVCPGTAEELRGHLRVALRARVRPILWSAPGMGKTALLTRLGRDLTKVLGGAAEVYTLIGSQCDPTDVGGFPVVVGAADPAAAPVVRMAPRDFARRLADHGGMLFLDELTCVTGATLASFLRLLADLVIGDVQLDPERVAVVAAANPADQAANGTELPPPTANRLLHLRFPEGAAAAREWATEFPTYWGAAPRLRFAGDEAPAGAYARARAYVAGFVHNNPGYWIQYPKESDRQGMAWPSPRQWDAVSRTMAVVLADGLPPAETGFLAAGLVGGGAAAAFLSFLRTADFPDPDELLADPKKYKPSGRPDVDYAVLASVVAAADARGTPAAFAAASAVVSVAMDKGKSVEACTPAALAIARSVQACPKAGDAAFAAELVPVYKNLLPFTAVTRRLRDAMAAEAEGKA